MPENEEMPLAETDMVAQSVDPHFIQGFKVGAEKQRQLAIDSGWIKAFPRSDSELISRERCESATGTCWCNDVPFTDVEKEDITRYIREGAEIQRDHMVMQGWRKVLGVEQLVTLIRNNPKYKWEYEGDYAQRLALALHDTILKGVRSG